MLFNSLEFLVFLPVVFALYWLIPKRGLSIQNLLVVGASYLFYGWWDWRFLSLILFSTVVDYTLGIAISNQSKERNKKLLLYLSLATNLGILGFFKYYNFFLDNLTDSLSVLGFELNMTTLNIILPVGISFYTFQTLSYTIDVYRKRMEPTRDFVAFAAFVSFFPQLVAGPIERATNLLPQFVKARNFDYQLAVNGCRQILWGFFKKVVIADNCSVYANDLFATYDQHSGITLIMGALFFTFQIYCDFSGYSDIAIGTSRLFGFNLMQNFAFPYFSRDIAEFWRRWHISLSTWFRDYLYIPLGGSKGGTAMKVRNTFAIFVVSGFWHGANWTFIVWGLLNAIYFLPLLLTNKNRSNIGAVAHGRLLPSITDVFKMGLTFGLTVIAWVFFRAENVGHAFAYLKQMASSLLSKAAIIDGYNYVYWELGATLPLSILGLLTVEWLNRDGQFGLDRMPKNLAVRWTIYALVLFAIQFLGNFNETEFIYFAF